MSSSLEEIERQEEDIFHELGCYDFQNEPQFKRSQDMAATSVKDKVQQQLAVSVDSPFRRELSEFELRRLKEERAAVLREETKEIKRQLDIVKNRLLELKISSSSSGGQSASNDNNEQKSSNINNNKEPQATSRGATTKDLPNPKHQAPPSRTTIRASRRGGLASKRLVEPKFRPLTGKADCPNCTCDRRSSVCDQCISLPPIQAAPIIMNKNTSNNNINGNNFGGGGAQNEPPAANKLKAYSEDDRPIRPAKEKTLAVVEAVNDVVVPSRVYTISKSLNEKRSKLAQAIGDLQLMMDQVKAKGDKLNQERKLVQLYKDQWKYGPSIGGPSASSRERLGIPAHQRRGYESRLDPNLSRDSKSLMGFQHIESGMKLRQYQPTMAAAASRRMASVKAKAAPSKQSVAHSRSKSLEQLKSPPAAADRSLQRAIANFQNGLSSSEVNLSSSPDDEVRIVEGDEIDRRSQQNEAEEEDEEVEEEEPEVGVIIDDRQRVSPSVEAHRDLGSNYAAELPTESTKIQPGDRTRDATKVQRMTWIPVFGETEIKTIKRVPTKRKLQVLGQGEQNGAQTTTTTTTSTKTTGQSKAAHNMGAIRRVTGQLGSANISQKPKSGYHQQQQQQQQQAANRPPARIVRSATSIAISRKSGGYGSGNSSRVMTEATRKLKFATSLLEQEHRDSSTKNQLIVNKTVVASPTKPTPARRLAARASPASSVGDQQQPVAASSTATSGQADRMRAKSLTAEASKEIARLEEMINEQQRLLAKLTQSQEHQLLLSPVAVSCSSPCCHHVVSPTTCKSTPTGGPAIPVHHHRHTSGTTTSGNQKSLIITLRDRLNKTRIRLARTLEEEREKHQQLKQRVDSSLRKQSDLENENELLKQSLSKCIDTCLRDISSTFESLSDTLADSIGNHFQNVQFEGEASSFMTNENQAPVLVGSGGDSAAAASVLTNAAQLIADNRHLKQMKNHIEIIERQRKGIFDELSKEKQRSQQLEGQLRESQAELNKLVGARQRLETQLKLQDNGEDTAEGGPKATAQQASEANQRQQVANDKLAVPDCQPSTSRQQQQQATPSTATTMNQLNQMDTSDKSDLDDTYNSVDLYRRFIQVMTPDIENMRLERKELLSYIGEMREMITNIVDK